MNQRVFDHLDGAPEDRRLSQVAREMRASSWWASVPERDEPADVSGEIDRVRSVLEAARDAGLTYDECAAALRRGRRC